MLMKKTSLSILLASFLFMLFTGTLSAAIDPMTPPPKQPSLNTFKSMFGGDFPKKIMGTDYKPDYLAVTETTWNVTSECFNVECMGLDLLDQLKLLKVPDFDKISTVLGDLGLIAAGLQLVIDASKGDVRSGLIKFLENLTLYGIGKTSHAMLKSAALAYAMTKYLLDKLKATSQKMRSDYWSERFIAYYENESKGTGGPRAPEAWRQKWRILLRGVDDFSEVKPIALYELGHFWDKNWIDDGEEYPRSFQGNLLVDGEAGFIRQYPDLKDQKAITEDYYDRFLATYLKTFLYSETKREAEIAYNKDMKILREALAEPYRLYFNISGPGSLLKERLTYKFGPWEGRTNYKGEAIFRFNLYSYFKAAVSPEVSIYMPDNKSKITVKLPKCTWDRCFPIKLNLLSKIDTRVFDKKTKKPIVGAKLKIKGRSFFAINNISSIRSISSKNSGGLAGIPSDSYYCQEIVSDKYGQFLLGNIPAGIYNIEITANGYNPVIYKKVRFINSRTKPFYLETCMPIALNIRADRMAQKLTRSSPEPYTGPINISIDVANYRAKISFKVKKEYTTTRIVSYGGGIITKDGRLVNTPAKYETNKCEDVFESDCWCDMKRLLKVGKGVYDFKTALFNYKSTTRTIGASGSAPEYSKRTLKNNFSGTIDLNTGKVSGSFTRGDSGGLQFNGKVQPVTQKKMTKQEIYIAIDSYLIGKKQSKRMSAEARQKMMKRVSKSISDVLKRSNKRMSEGF